MEFAHYKCYYYYYYYYKLLLRPHLRSLHQNRTDNKKFVPFLSTKYSSYDNFNFEIKRGGRHVRFYCVVEAAPAPPVEVLF